MSTRMLAWIAVGLWALTVLAGVLYFVRGQTLPSADGRRAIVLPPASRDRVLSEMRGMLASVEGVLTGLAEKDMKGVAQAARASGLAVAVDMSPQLMAALPLEFKQLGMAVHKSFDELAAAAETGAPTSEILSRLGAQLSSCVACHASYRLAAPEANVTK